MTLNTAHKITLGGIATITAFFALVFYFSHISYNVSAANKTGAIVNGKVSGCYQDFEVGVTDFDCADGGSSFCKPNGATPGLCIGSPSHVSGFGALPSGAVSINCDTCGWETPTPAACDWTRDYTESCSYSSCTRTGGTKTCSKNSAAPSTCTTTTHDFTGITCPTDCTSSTQTSAYQYHCTTDGKKTNVYTSTAGNCKPSADVVEDCTNCVDSTYTNCSWPSSCSATEYTAGSVTKNCTVPSTVQCRPTTSGAFDVNATRPQTQSCCTSTDYQSCGYSYSCTSSGTKTNTCTTKKGTSACIGGSSYTFPAEQCDVCSDSAYTNCTWGTCSATEQASGNKTVSCTVPSNTQCKPTNTGSTTFASGATRQQSKDCCTISADYTRTCSQAISSCPSGAVCNNGQIIEIANTASSTPYTAPSYTYTSTKTSTNDCVPLPTTTSNTACCTVNVESCGANQCRREGNGGTNHKQCQTYSCKIDLSGFTTTNTTHDTSGSSCTAACSPYVDTANPGDYTSQLVLKDACPAGSAPGDGKHRTYGNKRNNVAGSTTPLNCSPDWVNVANEKNGQSAEVECCNTSKWLCPDPCSLGANKGKTVNKDSTCVETTCAESGSTHAAKPVSGTVYCVDNTASQPNETLPQGRGEGSTLRFNGSAWSANNTIFNNGSVVGIGGGFGSTAPGTLPATTLEIKTATSNSTRLRITDATTNNPGLEIKYGSGTDLWEMYASHVKTVTPFGSSPSTVASENLRIKNGSDLVRINTDGTIYVSQICLTSDVTTDVTDSTKCITSWPTGGDGGVVSESDPIVKAINGLVSSNGSTISAITTSTGLAGILSDETGTGALVFGTAPTFITSIITPLVLGGATANNILTLQGNNASMGNTLTSPNIQLKVGDSGATVAMTILNNGNVGIGAVTPEEYEVSRFVVKDNDATKKNGLYVSLQGNDTTISTTPYPQVSAGIMINFNQIDALTVNPTTKKLTIKYSVMNIGMKPLKDVAVTDANCSSVSAVLANGKTTNIGDANENNVLDIMSPPLPEWWIFTCETEPISASIASSTATVTSKRVDNSAVVTSSAKWKATLTTTTVDTSREIVAASTASRSAWVTQDVSGPDTHGCSSGQKWCPYSSTGADGSCINSNEICWSYASGGESKCKEYYGTWCVSGTWCAMQGSVCGGYDTKEKCEADPKAYWVKNAWSEYCTSKSYAYITDSTSCTTLNAGRLWCPINSNCSSSGYTCEYANTAEACGKQSGVEWCPYNDYKGGLSQYGECLQKGWCTRISMTACATAGRTWCPYPDGGGKCAVSGKDCTY